MFRRYAFHPLLIGAFPVMFLWSQNRNEVLFGDVTGPLLMATAATLSGFVVVSLVIRDHRRGALVASGLAFLAMSYGHGRDLIPGASEHPGLLLIAWALIAVVATRAALRLDEGVPEATKIANIVALTLLLMVVLPLTSQLTARTGSSGTAVSASGATGTSSVAPSAARDIFYIVPDMYARGDNYEELFGFDNGEFLGYLEDRGFHVADESVANYNKTAHSLASTLNLEYLDELSEQVERSGTEASDWQPVYDLLRDHKVGRFLTEHGYRHIQLGMWWEPTADATTADVTYRYGEATEFGSVFRHTTILPAIRAMFGLQPEDRGYRGEVRRTTLYQLEKLEELAGQSADQPRFVFTHLSLPHAPHVFEADGSWVTEEEEASRTHAENVVAQVKYTNLRLRRIVDRLLSGPEDEHPIIIIQSDEADHPARYRDDQYRFIWAEATEAELLQKFRILSAYYLPGPARGEEPQEDRTPVNTFRFLFDRYFGTDHGLLPDHSYVIYTHHQPYDFVEVTDRVRTADAIPEGFDP